MLRQNVPVSLLGVGCRVLQMVHLGKLWLLQGCTASSLVLKWSIAGNGTRWRALVRLRLTIWSCQVKRIIPSLYFFALWLRLLYSEVAILGDVRVRFKLLRLWWRQLLQLLVQLLEALGQLVFLLVLILIMQCLR